MKYYTKIIILFSILCLSYSGLYSQATIETLDSLNIYQVFIKEIREAGLNINDLMASEVFIETLSKQNLELDSLKYYLDLEGIKTTSNSGFNNNGFIAVEGKVYDDSIVIRWAPTTIDLWTKLKKSGYKVTREETTTQNKDGRIITSFDSYKVLADSIKPWSLQEIEANITPEDSMSMIAAQAIFGTSFGSKASPQNLDFVSREKERQMRFGIALLMADRSSQAADLQGLRYVDTNIEKGKTYVYYVQAINSERQYEGSTSLINDRNVNKRVNSFGIVPKNGINILFWPKFANKFSGYWIDRSQDGGKTWVSLSKSPIVFIEQNNVQDDDLVMYDLDNKKKVTDPDAFYYYLYSDSIKTDLDLTYRIRGLSPFSDMTEPEIVSTNYIDRTPPPIPQLVFNEVDEKSGIASIEWNMGYEKDEMLDLLGFTIWESIHPDSSYIQISDFLPKETRSFTSEPLLKNRSHYFIIQAKDENGNKISSFPIYMHYQDHESPAPPLDPIYTVDDSTGVVTLRWKANKELDMAGYRIYFSNSLTNEFTQLTSEPISRNIYYDTIQLITLTEFIYYKFQAVDKSTNRSEFSEILRVKRPDLVAPIAPLMDYPEITAEAIKLKWRTSSSTDVVQQILYRRLADAGQDWSVLFEMSNTKIDFFIDSTAKVEQLYEYTIRALDSVGHYSGFAFPAKGRRWFNGTGMEISNVTAVFDSKKRKVNLKWEYVSPNHEVLKDIEYVFYIYRSIGDLELVRYKMIDGSNTIYIDADLKKDEVYNYTIKVVYKNGKSGPLTEPVTVSVNRKKE